MNTTRRVILNLNIPAELAIHNAIQEVEKLGADTRLTNIVLRLSNAKELLGDYVDGIVNLGNAANLDSEEDRTQWKTINPKFKNGEFMPEGENVLMYNQNTNVMFVAFRYSSHPDKETDEVTHWMHLPKPPVKKQLEPTVGNIEDISQVLNNLKEEEKNSRDLANSMSADIKDKHNNYDIKDFCVELNQLVTSNRVYKQHYDSFVNMFNDYFKTQYTINNPKNFSKKVFVTVFNTHDKPEFEITVNQYSHGMAIKLIGLDLACLYMEELLIKRKEERKESSQVKVTDDTGKELHVSNSTGGSDKESLKHYIEKYSKGVLEKRRDKLVEMIKTGTAYKIPKILINDYYTELGDIEKQLKEIKISEGFNNYGVEIQPKKAWLQSRYDIVKAEIERIEAIGANYGNHGLTALKKELDELTIKIEELK